MDIEDLVQRIELLMDELLDRQALDPEDVESYVTFLGKMCDKACCSPGEIERLEPLALHSLYSALRELQAEYEDRGL